MSMAGSTKLCASSAKPDSPSECVSKENDMWTLKYWQARLPSTGFDATKQKVRPEIFDELLCTYFKKQGSQFYSFNKMMPSELQRELIHLYESIYGRAPTWETRMVVTLCCQFLLHYVKKEEVNRS